MADFAVMTMTYTCQNLYHYFRQTQRVHKHVLPRKSFKVFPKRSVASFEFNNRSKTHAWFFHMEPIIISMDNMLARGLNLLKRGKIWWNRLTSIGQNFKCKNLKIRSSDKDPRHFPFSCPYTKRIKTLATSDSLPHKRRHMFHFPAPDPVRTAPLEHAKKDSDASTSHFQGPYSQYRLILDRKRLALLGKQRNCVRVWKKNTT